MRARSKGKGVPSHHHGVRWQQDKWQRIAKATNRHAQRTRLKVTAADIIRIAVDEYLERDEAGAPEQLAS
jgi:1,6-anhydro-N-acetylmuramate kinase